MRRLASAICIMVILAYFIPAVLASVTFTPPDTGQVHLATVMLKGEKAAPRASGTVSLVCSRDNSKGTLTVIANGLDSKKVYTVWLVGAGNKTTGVGKAPYRLPVNAKGFANMAAPVRNCGQIVRQKLTIYEQPTKNPSDTKQRNIALSATLGGMAQGG